MNDSIRLTQEDDGRDKTFADNGFFYWIAFLSAANP
ncbi:hypothetical protein PS865_02153 [Pseudomonas fluorescens]|nr:hypothetical protein PS865_02153 [Pseudomonas fluorescens]